MKAEMAKVDAMKQMLRKIVNGEDTATNDLLKSIEGSDGEIEMTSVSPDHQSNTK